MDISAGGHVVVTDTEGAVTTWSAGAEALSGYARGEVVGRPVDVIVPEHLRGAHWGGLPAVDHSSSASARDASAGT